MMMTNAISSNEPSIVTGGSVFGNCSQMLMDLVNKVKEVFMAILRTILPCFFSAASIEPKKVTNLTTPAQTNQKAQDPTSPTDQSLGAPSVPILQPGALPPDVREPQPQNVVLQPELQTAPPQQQEAQPPEPPVDVPGGDALLQLQDHQPPGPPPDAADVVPGGQEDDVPGLIGGRNQDAVDAALLEAAGVARLQRVAHELRGIDVHVSTGYEREKEVEEEEAESPREYSLLPVTTISSTELLMANASSAVVLQAFRNFYNADLSKIQQEDLNLLVRQGNGLYKPETLTVEMQLAELGLALGKFDIPEYNQRYLRPHYPTLYVSEDGGAVVDTSYCERIQDSCAALKASDNLQAALLKVGRRTYGWFIPQGRRMKTSVYLLNPYYLNGLICFQQFASIKDFVKYFTKIIEPLGDEYNCPYSMNPIVETTERQKDPVENKEEAGLPDHLQPAQAVAGLYAAFTALRELSEQSKNIEDGTEEANRKEANSWLYSGSEIFYAANNSDCLAVIRDYGGSIEELEGQFTRSEWVDQIPNFVKDNKAPLHILLTNDQFTHSYAMVIIPQEDNDRLRIRFFSANDNPAWFRTFNSLAALKVVLSDATKYSAYKVCRFEQGYQHQRTSSDDQRPPEPVTVTGVRADDQD